MASQATKSSVRRDPILLDGALTIEDLVAVAERRAEVMISPEARSRLPESCAALNKAIERGERIYGVTTGFGALLSHDLPAEQWSNAQVALLRSHASGVGPPLARSAVRAAMALRANSLLRGFSAIRAEPLDGIVAMLNADLIPTVPRIGSLGASGDLAPSAHAFLPLIGEGEVTDSKGQQMSGAEALNMLGIEPVELGAKEGLALLNGTHFMAAIGALATAQFESRVREADLIAALTVAALDGARDAFDPRIHRLRPLEGQQASAELVRFVLEPDSLEQSTTLQDAYSLRCIPQIHGAAREASMFVRRLVGVDLEAVTDNPLVFSDPPAVLSGGNFHGQSLALAFDVARIAAADLGSVSERRSFRLLSPSTNRDLPPFLSSSAGVSSGYMVAQYAAAALLGELRALAHPVSIDSVPSSDNQEDHVSMGMTGAWMFSEAVDRLRQVLAVELLCACQALDYRQVESSSLVSEIHRRVRERVPPLDLDRPPADDIVLVADLIAAGELDQALSEAGWHSSASTNAEPSSPIRRAVGQRISEEGSVDLFESDLEGQSECRGDV
jgi:histidine ammonia-lyase